MKTTKEAVIKATSDLADEKGLNNVSLKAVAQKLNIRTPSLYNHIESLDNLLLNAGSLSIIDDSCIVVAVIQRISPLAIAGFNICAKS